ncbi:ATP-binding protein [Streptomonospora sp. NEAU-YY374]|nr:ATP-binding protein [Streptomonospora nanhaiensis]
MRRPRKSALTGWGSARPQPLPLTLRDSGSRLVHHITASPDPTCPGARRRDPDHQLTFAGQPASVGVMRDWVAQHLRRGPHAYPPELIDDLLVCASEIGTNAVRHSRSGLPGGVFTASLWQSPGAVCLEVRDMGPRPGRPSAPRINGTALDDPVAETGRGLSFVFALCGGNCGSTAPPHPRGHTVWCELEVGTDTS